MRRKVSRLTAGHDCDQFLTSTNWPRTCLLIRWPDGQIACWPYDQVTICDVMETNTDTEVEIYWKRNPEYFAFILPVAFAKSTERSHGVSYLLPSIYLSNYHLKAVQFFHLPLTISVVVSEWVLISRIVALKACFLLSYYDQVSISVIGLTQIERHSWWPYDTNRDGYLMNHYSSSTFPFYCFSV